MPKYSIITAQGSAQNYLTPSSDLRKLMTGWGEQGYEVINVIGIKGDHGKDGVLVTLQKAEPRDGEKDLLSVIREVENPPRTRSTD